MGRTDGVHIISDVRKYPFLRVCTVKALLLDLVTVCHAAVFYIGRLVRGGASPKQGLGDLVTSLRSSQKRIAIPQRDVR